MTTCCGVRTWPRPGAETPASVHRPLPPPRRPLPPSTASSGCEVRPSAPVARDSSSAFAMLALPGPRRRRGGGLQSVDGCAHDLRLLLAPGRQDIFRGMTVRSAKMSERWQASSSRCTRSSRANAGCPNRMRHASRLDAAASEATLKQAAQQQRSNACPAAWRGLMPAATRADVVACFRTPRRFSSSCHRR